jgi:hypothetical protein
VFFTTLSLSFCEPVLLKRKCSITLNLWYMHRVLNIDEIKTNYTIWLYFARRTFWA